MSSLEERRERRPAAAGILPRRAGGARDADRDGGPAGAEPQGMFPRRFLPSVAQLAAFEASARSCSFTEAARQLGLTQSAVSRQIRSLENQLGVQLFVREHQTVRLTLAGQSYARDVREALLRIGASSRNLRANPRGGVLNLAVLPTFSIRWLIPRLGRFRERHPEIAINLGSRLEGLDFRRDTMDAAIHFDLAGWRGTRSLPLLAETLLPMASPRVAAQRRVWRPDDLADAPLLHLASRPDAWGRWFHANGCPCDGLAGMLLDQWGQVAEAAKCDLGIALLPEFLFEAERRRGELVPITGRALATPERYLLTWPLELEDYHPLTAFRQWLAAELRPEGAGRDRPAEAACPA